MIMERVNCWKTRCIYYGMAISSSLSCLRATLVELWLLPCWEKGDERVKGLFLYATLSLVLAILVVRSLCVPVPRITTETNRMGEEKRWDLTLGLMLVMFLQSYSMHSIELGTYMFEMIVGWMAIKQLSWPAQDVYIRHILLIDYLSCFGAVLGYQEPLWLLVFAIAFASLALLTCYFILCYQLRLFYGKAKRE